MKTRALSPNAFTIRIIFLLLLVVMALIMKIISLFNTGQTNIQSGPKLQIADKEMICQVPEKSILLDGLAVTLSGALILNESEHTLLRESFLKQSLKGWTVLTEDANTFRPKTGI